MKQLGFNASWIGWVMECVRTVSLSITVNGEAGESFHPSRSIRQGCPLSPYLFLLCGEGFTALCNDYVREKLLYGFRINRHCPIVSHLLFADDSDVYCQAMERDCVALYDILEIYETASGQKINKDKLSFFFSPNILPEDRLDLAWRIGISMEAKEANYLGLPVFLGHSKCDMFYYIKQILGQIQQEGKS